MKKGVPFGAHVFDSFTTLSATISIISNITDATVNAVIWLGLYLGGIVHALSLPTMFMPGQRGPLISQIGAPVRRGFLASGKWSTLVNISVCEQEGDHISEIANIAPCFQSAFKRLRKFGAGIDCFWGMALRLILLVVALFAFAPDPVAAKAKRCSPAEKAEALEPASPSNKSVRLTCNLTLEKGERVTKQIRIWGAKASDVKILCRGGRIGTAGPASLHFRKDLIQIKSVKLADNRWSRPENVIIDGCEVNGAIRIMGLGQNGQAKNVKISSRRANHTEAAQASAPRGIVLRNLTVRGDGRIPVYFAPGVTHSKLVNSRITGRSVSSGLYLDAESAHNVVRGNVFAVKTAREVISVDGSAHNIIENNRVQYADLGGVYVYRNCGEGGAARHQKPRFNQILGNTFSYEGTRSARPTIWLSFSSIARQVFLCPLDRAIPYGSGADDRNFANNNKVIGNAFLQAPTDEVVRDAGKNNIVRRNRRMNK